jgi:hypothetical protein
MKLLVKKCTFESKRPHIDESAILFLCPHQALISEALLEAPAREAVEFLLGGPGGLARESTWADGVRGGSSPYSWTGPLHYFNTPDFGKVVRSCELQLA